jgi:hypothetical protein
MGGSDVQIGTSSSSVEPDAGRRMPVISEEEKT